MTVLAQWPSEKWYQTVWCHLCGHAHEVSALIRDRLILDVENVDGEPWSVGDSGSVQRFRRTLAHFHCPGFGHPERAEGDILVATAVVDEGWWI